MPADASLHTAARDGVYLVTLARPEKKNAITHAMYTALAEAVEEAGRRDDVRVLLLRGAGDTFTAGNDLHDFATLHASGGSVDALPAVRFMERVVDFEKPLVAAVRGAAVGIGTTVLMHCDAVVADPTARFSLPFTRLGLVPEFGSSLLLPRLAGPVRAAHALLLGEPFGLEEARSMGLVSHSCADGALDREAEALARRLAALPGSSVRAAKALLRPPEQRAAVHAAIRAELERFAEGLASAAHREALAAFFEKRAPDFSAFP